MKKIRPFLLIGTAASLVISYPFMIAQADLSTPTSNEELNSSLNESSAVNLPLAPDTDGAAFIPSSLNVSDQPYSDDVRARIGVDDREPVLDFVYPLSSIGRLDWVDAQGQLLGHCTATLIGPDIILTNSHCLVNPTTQQISLSPAFRSERLVFRPAFRNGSSSDSARVISYQYGWQQGGQDPEQDWAVLRLDSPLGDENGYMGWRALDFSDPLTIQATQGKLHVVGYSGDFPTPEYREWGAPGETAGLHRNCSVVQGGTAQNGLEGLLFHECDTNPGASGSPIFALFDDGQYYVVGLHAGSNELSSDIRLSTGLTSNVINRGVQVSQWSTTAASMR